MNVSEGAAEVVQIVVTAMDGTRQTYNVTIRRIGNPNARLTSARTLAQNLQRDPQRHPIVTFIGIALSPIRLAGIAFQNFTLQPIFDPAVYNYSIGSIDNCPEVLTLTPIIPALKFLTSLLTLSD